MLIGGGWLAQLGTFTSTAVLYNLVPSQVAQAGVPWCVQRGWLPRPRSSQQAQTYNLLAVLAVVLALAVYEVIHAVRAEAGATSLYALVGVSGGRFASEAAIRRRWRLLAKTLHPDKLRRTLQSQPVALGQAEAHFATLAHATQTLLDPAARDAYDRVGLIAPPVRGTSAPSAGATGLTPALRPDTPVRLRTALAEAAATYLVRLIAVATFQSPSGYFPLVLLSLAALACECQLLLAPYGPATVFSLMGLLLPQPVDSVTPYTWARCVRAAMGAVLPALVAANRAVDGLVRGQVALARQTAALAALPIPALAAAQPNPHPAPDRPPAPPDVPHDPVQTVSLASAMRSTPVIPEPRPTEDTEPAATS